MIAQFWVRCIRLRCRLLALVSGESGFHDSWVERTLGRTWSIRVYWRFESDNLKSQYAPESFAQRFPK